MSGVSLRWWQSRWLSNCFPYSRKVADVKREQELAERRKNEPQMATNQDHLVRKIFSKFRRAPHPHTQGSKDTPSSRDVATHSDVEKGDAGAGDHDRGKLPAKLTLSEDMRTLSAAQSPSPSPSPSSGPPSARGKASKWGRLLGSSSVDSASDTSTKVAVSRSLSARESLRESVAQGRQGSVSGGSNGGQGNKVFPKATKLAPSPATSLARQDTIDEGGEGDSVSPIPVPQGRLAEHRLSIDRAASLSLDRGSSERNLSLERERQIEMACSRATMIDTYDTGLREQPSTLAERDLVATVMDMKVDMRLEMQRMNQRISKIEDMLGDLVKRLSGDINTSTVSTPGTVVHQPPTEELSSTFSVAAASPPVQPSTSSVSVSTTPVLVESPVTESAAGSLGTSTTGSTSGSTSGGGGNGLAPLMMKKRRSKSRKAPPPPPGRSLPEQERLLDPSDAQQTGSGSKKRDFL